MVAMLYHVIYILYIYIYIYNHWSLDAESLCNYHSSRTGTCWIVIMCVFTDFQPGFHIRYDENVKAYG